MQISNHESNARFSKKDLKLEYATLDALIKYYENGGVVTKVASKRPKSGVTVSKVKVNRG